MVLGWKLESADTVMGDGEGLLQPDEASGGDVRNPEEQSEKSRIMVHQKQKIIFILKRP